MGNVEKAVTAAIEISNDPAHGYSQIRRWGPDYDCSSFVITVFDQAGFAVKAHGASYTGNMLSAFTKAGFKSIAYSPALALKRGDVLLNVVHHTAIYIGNGQIVEACIDESNGIQGRLSGDQTGHEIHVRSFYNFPWDYVLRAPEIAPADALEDPNCSYTTGNAIQIYAPMIRSGDIGPAVEAAAAALRYHGYDFDQSEAGIFSKSMSDAVKAFQKLKRIEVDGIIGPDTWRNLLYWR